MALSDYSGRSPAGEDGPRVVHVRSHRLWKPGTEATARCAQTGESLRLSEKHLLAVVEDDDGRAQKYFRDERSLEAWLDGEERDRAETA